MSASTVNQNWTRIEIILPVNNLNEIQAVTEILQKFRLCFLGATNSVFRSPIFEGHYVVRDQSVILDRVSLLFVDVNLPIDHPDLAVEIDIIKVIVLGEYQKAQSPQTDVWMTIHTLDRIL
jgi:hypothetical protein